jgi:plastocyanin
MLREIHRTKEQGGVAARTKERGSEEESGRPRKRRLAPTIAAVAAVLLFLGIVGAVADMIIATATEVRGGPQGGGAVQLGARNFGYIPDSIVAHGSSVTIRFTDDGYSEHTFTVDNKDLDVVVQPGQTRTIHLTAGASNVVEFYCRFHESYGMRGTIAFNR